MAAMTSAWSGNHRKRRAEAQAHTLVEMCLTSGRRAFLSFTWAAKLLKSPKRRRYVGGEVPWSGFTWLQHKCLHQAVTQAFRSSNSAGRGAAWQAGSSLPTDSVEHRYAQVNGSPHCVNSAEVVDLTLSDVSETTGLHIGDSGAGDIPAASSPSTSYVKAGRIALSDRAARTDGGVETLFSLQGGHDLGTPAALAIARSGTPKLSALRAQRLQPQPSACVAMTPAGPSSNLCMLTAADLGRLLQSDGWLNDESVNFYILLITKRAASEPGVANVGVEFKAGAKTAVAEALKEGPSSAVAAAMLAGPDSAPELLVEPAPPATMRSPAAGYPHRSPKYCRQGLATSPNGQLASREALGPAEAATTTAPPSAMAAASGERAPPSAPTSPLRGLISTVAGAAGCSSGAAAAAAMATAAATSAAVGLGSVVAAGVRQLAPLRRMMGGATDATGAAPMPAAATNFMPVMPMPQPSGSVLSVRSSPRLPQLAHRHQPPTVFAFNSFFFSNLTGGGDRRCFAYDEVRRWTLPRSTHTTDCVLTRDLLLFPINHGNAHWCLAAVWPRRRLLQYFDSFGGSRSVSDWVLDTLERWIRTDTKDKGVTLELEVACAVGATAATPRSLFGSATDVSEWRREASELRIPAQGDGCSCGVFVCTYAELLARGVPPHAFAFSQDDIPAIRCGMAEQILRGAL